jgi:hypothetical protein
MWGLSATPSAVGRQTSIRGEADTTPGTIAPRAAENGALRYRLAELLIGSRPMRRTLKDRERLDHMLNFGANLHGARTITDDCNLFAL